MRIRKVKRIARRCYVCQRVAKRERIARDSVIDLCRSCDDVLKAGGIWRLPLEEQDVFIELYRQGLAKGVLRDETEA